MLSKSTALCRSVMVSQTSAISSGYMYEYITVSVSSLIFAPTCVRVFNRMGLSGFPCRTPFVCISHCDFPIPSSI
jgi:hypothetical protein